MYVYIYLIYIYIYIFESRYVRPHGCHLLYSDHNYYLVSLLQYCTLVGIALFEAPAKATARLQRVNTDSLGKCTVGIRTANSRRPLLADN